MFLITFVTTVGSDWRYTIRSFSSRDYLFLWLGNIFMMSGMLMQSVAQGYLVYDLTNSGRILGIVSSAYGLPVLLLALIGGVTADRFNRKLIIQIGQVTAVIMALFIAVSITTESLTWIHLLIASIVQGILWCFIGPARASLAPDLVASKDSSNAIGLLSAGVSGCSLIAPLMAGVIYAVAGPAIVYYTVCIFAVMGVLFTTSMSSKTLPRPVEIRSVVFELMEAVGNIWSNGIVRIVLASSVAFVLLLLPFNYLIPVLVVDVYHRETIAQGVLAGTLGLGSLLGAIIIAGLPNESKRGLILIASGIVSGFTLVLVAATPVYWIAIGLMLIIGLSFSSQWSLTQIIIISKVPRLLRGRVMSLLIMVFGLAPLGLFPAGFFIDMVGPRPVVATMGVLILLFTVSILGSNKNFRNLQ